MNAFWQENGTKILGALTAGFGALQGYLASGAFEKLLSEVTIGWMGIILGTATAVLGGATMARGFNNSAQAKVATAIDNALQATPASKQSGFARIWQLVVVALLSAALLSACATQSIERQLSTGAQVHAAATRSVSNALDAHAISSKDAEAYREIAVNASEVLDSARDLKDIDPETAEGKAQLANGILKELQDFLVKQLEKQP